jgi:hypothetical protein
LKTVENFGFERGSRPDLWAAGAALPGRDNGFFSEFSSDFINALDPGCYTAAVAAAATLIIYVNSPESPPTTAISSTLAPHTLIPLRRIFSIHRQ